MKRGLFVAVFAAVFCLTATAGKRNVKFEDLPVTIQSFVNDNFPGEKVSMVLAEDEFRGTTYDIVLGNGTTMEFDKNGDWTELRARGRALPVSVIPAGIVSHLQENMPGQMVMKIERDDDGYDVDLTDGTEIKYDRNFRVLEVDFD